MNKGYDASAIIEEAARLILDPGPGVLSIQMRVDGDHTKAVLRTGKGTDVTKCLKAAIAALEAELEGFKSCPAHAALTKVEDTDEPDGFCRMHFEQCDYFTSRGLKSCNMDCCS